MVRVDWLEDENGNLTKVIVSDKKISTMHMNDKDGNTLYAVEITEEMEDAITGDHIFLI